MSVWRGPRSVDPPRWGVDGRDWPNRQFSRFVPVGDSTFHVQIGGEGPTLLLLHGTGAGTHSFRDLFPLLSRAFRVIAPDLPGHAFTRVPDDRPIGLEGMSGLLDELVDTLEVEPDLVVGHSAGAAIGLRSVLDGRWKPRLVIGLNAALLPFRGPSRVFAPAARFAARQPLTASLAAWSAHDRSRVARTIESTGSRIDAQGVELYQRLARRSGHVFGTVRMMAAWDLESLGRDLPRLDVPLLLVVGGQDRAIPPADAREIAQCVADAEILRLRGLGHLAHEEAPGDVGDMILKASGRYGIHPRPR